MNRWIHGIAWNGINTAISQSCYLARILIVAAIIGPSEMGIFAVAISLTAGIAIISEFGFRQQYISRHADTLGIDPHQLLSDCWTGNLVLRLVAAAISVPIAILASNFVGELESTGTGVVIALSFTSVVVAASNPYLLKCERENNFRPSAISEAIGQVAGLGLLLMLIPWLDNVWLLVYGQIATALVQVGVSYLVGPRSNFTKPLLSNIFKLLHKGKPFFTISATTYATYNLDKLLIGAMQSPAAAGTYFVAQRIAELHGALFTAVIGRTLLPNYAEAVNHHDKNSLGLAIRRYSSINAFLLIAALIVFYLITNSPLIAKLPPDWKPAYAIFPILLAGVAARSACHVLSPALLVLGRVDLDARMKVQEALAYLIILPVSIYLHGIVGAAFSFLVIYAASFYRRLVSTRRTMRRM